MPGHKVCVIGAAGGIGQPLSLLLKNNRNVSELSLYDVNPLVNGVCADLGHIETPAKVRSEAGMEPERLRKALAGCNVVVIPAGVPRKEGMTRADLFKINAGIVRGIAEGVADVCPEAKVCIISNPVNSTVPVFVGTLIKKGISAEKAHKHVFGVSTLDIVRSNTFISEALGMDVNQLADVTVVGGHSGVTIVPLLSQIKSKSGENLSSKLTAEKIEQLTNRIQNAGTEVVKAKAGAGSATLSMAYAGAKFADAVMRGLDGEKGVNVCTYVKSTVASDKGVDYFASVVTLGSDGIDTIHGLPETTHYEQDLLSVCFENLKTNITTANEFLA